ncbi:MAG: hypothetical protein ACR2H4_04095 [Pyrinomonadaceae bacterium]
MPNSAEEAKLQRWLTGGEALGISSITWSEFLCGPLTSEDEELAQIFFPGPEPFLALDAYQAAQLF